MKDMTYEEWLELDEIVIPLKPDLWREMEDISLAYAIMVSNNLDPNGYFELKNSCTDWGGSPPQQYYPAWFSERLAVMESAIRTGTLKRTVTDKDHFGNNTVNTRIEMAGFLAWCKGKEFEIFAPQQGGEETAAKVDAVTSRSSDALPVMTKRLTLQEDTIEKIIRDTLKLDPLKLKKPKAGSAGVKADVRKSLLIPSPLFQSNSIFNKAWQRLRDQSRISDE